MCVCMFICIHTDLHVCVYMLAYRHAEFACVCVHIYIYVGLVYMSVHVYLHTCMPNLHVCVCMFARTHTDLHMCVYILTYMYAELAGVCVSIYIYIG